MLVDVDLSGVPAANHTHKVSGTAEFHCNHLTLSFLTLCNIILQLLLPHQPFLPLYRFTHGYFYEHILNVTPLLISIVLLIRCSIIIWEAIAIHPRKL